MTCRMTAEPGILIDVWGEEGETPLHVRDDGGLVKRLLHWLCACDDLFPLRSLTSGGGRYTAVFRPADAERVMAWLAAQGVRP